MRKFKYYILSSQGNPTALVEGIIKNKNIRKQINDIIIKKHDGFVEQVGFINKEKNCPQLLMAGGEFCGDASLCAIEYYLNKTPGNISLDVLEVGTKLCGGINNDNNVWINFSLPRGSYKKNNNTAIIKMIGITHLLVEYNNLSGLDIENLEKYAKNLIANNNLLDSKCVGVIYIKRNKNRLEILPYVYTRDVDTWIFESACGSGSLAVGINEYNRLQKEINMKIVQPSGGSIIVHCNADEKNYYIKLENKVTLLKKDYIILDNSN